MRIVAPSSRVAPQYGQSRYFKRCTSQASSSWEHAGQYTSVDMLAELASDAGRVSGAMRGIVPDLPWCGVGTAGDEIVTKA